MQKGSSQSAIEGLVIAIFTRPIREECDQSTIFDCCIAFKRTCSCQSEMSGMRNLLSCSSQNMVYLPKRTCRKEALTISSVRSVAPAIFTRVGRLCTRTRIRARIRAVEIYKSVKKYGNKTNTVKTLKYLGIRFAVQINSVNTLIICNQDEHKFRFQPG